MLLPRSFSQRSLPGISILLCAQTLNVSAQVSPRISGPVSNASMVRLARTTHPRATASNDIGRAGASLPMEHMLLQLSGSPAQEAAIEALLAAQHDPSSASYHQWLTPEQFGERFGAAQADLDAIADWLKAEGFTVNAIPAGRRNVDFSGTADQVERAFRTEIHRYNVDGVDHIANATDISIPSALAPVVTGVVSLHNFEARPLHKVIRRKPMTDLSGNAFGMSPFDFAAIYDVAALWNLSFDGAGQTVAIAGRTNINLSDIATFRSTFGLPGNNTQVVVNGTNPGIVSSGEETEADLDVEWAGAVAKGATIKLVVSASTNTTDGIDLSNQYIVNNNLASVMSVSFGGCEAQAGGSNAFYNNLWQQAAAQGISVFVSTGDSGSAGCDLDFSTTKSGVNNTQPASHGLAVNGLASTPYNVAVGGTGFNDAGNPSAFWNPANDAHYASAKGYIPEVAWNESSFTVGASSNGLFSGGGGVSQIYAAPSWQTGLGVPASDPGANGQHHRYLPDVSLNAAGHDGYLIFQEGQLELVGGTSAASPSFAGLMAILNQYSNGRSGNPNPRLYTLATQFPSIFHDITSGTNAVPCTGGSSGCSSTVSSANGMMDGYAATPGYDLATGLGSVDAYALALKWAAPPVALSITSFNPNPMTTSPFNQTLTINGSGFQTGASVIGRYPGVASSLYVISQTSTQIQVVFSTGDDAHVWSIQVTNPNGALSNSANLTVNTPAQRPTITSLSPSPMTGSNSSQTLTINGTGFAAGDTVQAVYPGGPVTALQILSINATQILASITTGTSARTWMVQVLDANSVASNTASISVTAPAAPPTPLITGVSSLTASNTNQILTITGTGFVPGNGLLVVAGYGNVGSLQQIISATSTQIQVQIDPGTTPRTWEVEVIGSNGPSNVFLFPVQ